MGYIFFPSFLMSRTFARTLILSLAASSLLVACGGSAPANQPAGNGAMMQSSSAAMNGNAMMQGDQNNMQVTTSEGTFVAGSTMPADWPTDVPTYAGAKVQYSATAHPTDGKTGSAIVFMTSDVAATVANFYKTKLVENGWTMTATMEANGTTILGATKDTRNLSVMIGASEGQTAVTIGFEIGAN